MGDVLDEAAAFVQCKECPWYKGCVTPMRVSPEDVRRQLMSARPGTTNIFGAGPSSGDELMRLLGDMSLAAQNMLLEGCPIFIERLRANPKLAERIKHLMQTWGLEEEPDHKKSPS